MEDWGTLEIVLILLLVIAVLGNIGNKGAPYRPLETASSFDGSPSATIGSEKEKWCGLTLSTPKSLEQLSSQVFVSGNISGCRWEATETTALFAQVVNNKGVPISAFSSIPIKEQSDKNVFFSTVIPLSTTYIGKGYLILVPARSQTEAVSVRVPLQFSR